MLIISNRRLLSFCSLVLALSGCSADSGSDDNGTPNTSLDLEISASTDSRGRSSISFQVAPGVNKVGVSASSVGNSIRFTNFDGGGNDYLSPSGVEISLAEEFSSHVNTVNGPSRGIDPSFGDSAKFNVSVETSADQNEEVTFRVTSRADSNLSSGRLRLNVFYVGSIGAEATTKTAVRSAIEEAKRIFANSASITLDLSEYDISGPVTLPSPVDGGELYRKASASAASPAVNVFIGGDITDSNGEVLGISSGIPGPATPTWKSGVAISVFAGAGSDGIFSDADNRLLGETIAHESGHFMGLFHPVDFSGSVVAFSDPLPDTPTCSFVTDCVAQESLIRNLMYSSPVSNGSGGFIQQNQLTQDQRSVLNRYAAVD